MNVGGGIFPILGVPSRPFELEGRRPIMGDSGGGRGGPIGPGPGKGRIPATGGLPNPRPA
jgi:hypothetical protein